MSTTARALTALALCTSLGFMTGCLVAAAGAGAGGAVYFTERGTESVLSASVARVFDATRETFQEQGISETKTSTEQEGAGERRQLEGAKGDREVTVTIRTEGSGSKVEVVARKTPVTWDKDFAKSILESIVAKAG